MSKDKASLFVESFKGVPGRMDAAIVNFTKSMNDASKALEDKMNKEIKMSDKLLKQMGLTNFSKEIEECRKNSLPKMEYIAKKLEREAARDLPCEVEDLVDTLVLAINKSVNSGTGENSKKEDATEWKNGDKCRYINDLSHDCIYVGAHPHGDSHFVLSGEEGITCIANDCIVKPETESQRLERQRLESAYDLACIAGYYNIWGNQLTFDNFKQDKAAVNLWLAVVDETKYLRG